MMKQNEARPTDAARGHRPVLWFMITMIEASESEGREGHVSQLDFAVAFSVEDAIVRSDGVKAAGEYQ